MAPTAMRLSPVSWKPRIAPWESTWAHRKNVMHLETMVSAMQPLCCQHHVSKVSCTWWWRAHARTQCTIAWYECAVTWTKPVCSGWRVKAKINLVLILRCCHCTNSARFRFTTRRRKSRVQHLQQTKSPMSLRFHAVKWCINRRAGKPIVAREESVAKHAAVCVCIRLFFVTLHILVGNNHNAWDHIRKSLHTFWIFGCDVRKQNDTVSAVCHRPKIPKTMSVKRRHEIASCNCKTTSCLCLTRWKCMSKHWLCYYMYICRSILCKETSRDHWETAESYVVHPNPCHIPCDDHQNSPELCPCFCMTCCCSCCFECKDK